ncbi:F0F1 ATP synthase subunit gamma [Vallicoccus soli]|uniref:ATP synthase gamma chain n=1 Tax=Vallicoccus soli TaxID=2339232 RepID=A0A3A3Z426_9ACTN|nr:F0F1 ATP synthase subunit gamma [Vallicoccus soli]RJK98154.1 F0F1 ATP synthase subunit gamma [Vallicoccus soli]
MGAQLRVYRRRIRSVNATKKITRAMELISASRIVKAQQRVQASRPYAEAIVRALEAASSVASVDHPLLASGREARRAAVLVVSSDRGLAGAYSSNAIKQGEALTTLLREEGKEVVPYLVGRKAVSFYRFRGREVREDWTGFTDNPTFEDAKEIADTLIADFLRPTEEGGVDEIHVVYTHFRNMGVQEPRAVRILPLVVEDSEATGAAGFISDDGAPDEPDPTFQHGAGPGSPDLLPLYEFEPSAERVLDALLPRYVTNLVYNALLLAAASEHAARRRAMKAATDNADELAKSLTRAANAARQAEITQEISEIVGGANALADATAGSE